MTVSIPAAAIVSVVPNVIGAGGTGLDLSGLVLTNNIRVPIGTVQAFSSVAGVSAFFGPSAQETSLAVTYFNGFDNSNIKPASMLFAQYPATAVGAYLRGGNVSTLTLAQLQAINGVLTIPVAGTNVTSGTINLSAATSFSNAATLIQAGFTSPGFTVAYDSVSGAFVFTTTATGAAATLGFATGSLAAGLDLTAATGAVLSQGAVAGVPGTAMAAVIAQTQNFATFMTAFKPSVADMVAFAAWNNGAANDYLYVMWDNDITVTTNANTASAGYAITQANYSGTAMVYDPANGAALAAFLMGAIASIDFTQNQGRTNLTFRSQAGFTPGVTNRQVADQLIANGYNFYGSYATANSLFNFFYPGQATGPFAWIDDYIDQVWMNNGFQLALMNLLTQLKSVPYNAAGYGLIESAMLDQINAAVLFGAIRPGVPLSSLQAAEVNTAAGLTVSDTITQRGWYLQVAPAAPQVRAARASPPVTFWYTSGGSVQRLNVASVEVA